jgi:hypothetical protein
VPEEPFSLARGGLKGEHAPRGADLLGSEQSVKTVMRTYVYHDHTGAEKALNTRAFCVLEAAKNYGDPTKVVFREPPSAKG